MLASYNWILIGLIATSATVNWVAAWQWRQKLYYASKPFVLVFLILFFLLQGSLTTQKIPFLFGLIFSLIGDVFLIPRGTRWFVAGMGAFSIAQLFYNVGFNLSLPSLPVIVLSVFAVMAAGLVIHLAVDRFSRNSSVNKMILPFFKGYAVLVLGMAVSALISLARPGWSDLAAVMGGMGGVLFFLSDMMIGLDKLDRRLPKYRFWIIFTYHIAQFLIVAAVLSLSGL